jgi:hypothetical protein
MKATQFFLSYPLNLLSTIVYCLIFYYGTLFVFIRINLVVMTYNLKTIPDTGRIAADENWEIKYWAKILGCSIVEVVPAVKALLNPQTYRRRLHGPQIKKADHLK